MTGLLLALGALIATSVIGMLVSDEVKAQWNRACRALVGRAVGALPPEWQDRYSEEWLAELDAHSGGPISHMWWALSLAISRDRVARAVRSLPAPTTRVEDDTGIKDGITEEEGIEFGFEAKVEPVTFSPPATMFVTTVADASNAAARLLEIATRNGDELIAEARATRARLTGRPVPDRVIESPTLDLGIDLPTTIRIKTTTDASNAAARLLEIATRNADELVEEARIEANRILSGKTD